jgi:hypothetical protein
MRGLETDLSARAAHAREKSVGRVYTPPIAALLEQNSGLNRVQIPFAWTLSIEEGSS